MAEGNLIQRIKLPSPTAYDTAYQIAFLHCMKLPYLAILIKIDGCSVPD